MWTTIGCGKLKWIRSAMKKWVEDKWNEGVLRWVNNQALTIGPAQEQRCAHATFERTYIKS
jgi:hypothetical protein